MVNLFKRFKHIVNNRFIARSKAFAGKIENQTHSDHWSPPDETLMKLFQKVPHTLNPLPSDHKTMMDCDVVGDYFELASKHLDFHGIQKGRLLEIGGSIARNAKDQFPDFDYTNLDMIDSDEIPTIVGDITDCSEVVESNSFDFIFNMHVFEHIRKPWLAAKEISRILKPGGITCTVTVWAWRYHPVQVDYWRFSPECLKFLFNDLECLDANFDSSCRRATRQGKWPNRADAVPVDEIGGWLESWNVFYVGRKP